MLTLYVAYVNCEPRLVFEVRQQAPGLELDGMASHSELRYQAIVRLDCVQGQEYAGHLVLNQKDAEKRPGPVCGLVSVRSAAEQAIIAFAQSDLMESAAKEDSGFIQLRALAQDKKKKKPFNKLTPEEHALRKAWSGADKMRAECSGEAGRRREPGCHAQDVAERGFGGKGLHRGAAKLRRW